MEGTVRWFDDKKGYGFITTDAGEDVFVHHTAIQQKGHRRLDDGERVALDTEAAEKGLKAANVVKLTPATVTA